MGRTGARQLVAGMVGGGIGADIGKTHRAAMRLDDRYVLSAGVFGRNRESSAQLGAELTAPANLVQPDHAEPSNSLTRSVFNIAVAAHTGFPPEVGAHDTSALTVVGPIETNDPQLANAERACTKSKRNAM